MKLLHIPLLPVAVLACLIAVQARAQEPVAKPQAAEEQPNAKPKFELLDGDRVVLLGGTLIEREQKYGWWELMLTCAYPDRHIVFRNLGWSGDTVWGESRAGFDPPAKGYDKLLAQVAAVKPTVIILGYGNVEAHAGVSDIPRFIAQYEKLLDDLKKQSAPGVRFLVISPMLMEKMDPPLPDPAEYNAKVVEYRKAIEAMAKNRSIAHVRPQLSRELLESIYELDPSEKPISPQLDALRLRTRITTDGLEVWDRGYRVIWRDIETQLRPFYSFNKVPKIWHTGTITLLKVEHDPDCIKPVKIESQPDRLTFTAERTFLSDEPSDLYFRELGSGMFEFHLDGKRMIGWSITPANKGAYYEIKNHPDASQYKTLHETIKRKNFLYFSAYRPQNDTYLFGFRKHEQGSNAAEVQELLKLVDELDREITKLKKPKPHTYELIRIGDAKAEKVGEQK